MGRLGRGTLIAGSLIASLAACGGSKDPTAADPPHFVADSGGIDHRYEGDFQYFVGGGVAAFDCDDDGRSDLFLAGGSAPAALYRNDSPTGGALRFTALASPVTDLSGVTGAYPLDVDSDGHVDLAVLRVGEDVVLRGLGGCRFEPANEALGLEDADSWTVAFSATWEGSSDLPTLAFGDYLASDRQSCEDSRLLRPAPDGGRYAAPVALAPGYCTLSVLFSDWARSGQRDLRMTNDRHYSRDGADQLWRVAPGEAPVLYTEADGWRPLRIWGMGIASTDLTGDGRPEVFLTSQGDNKLQTLAEGSNGPAYEDVALDRGATAHRPFTGGDVLPSTAWHAEFADVNNDGFAGPVHRQGQRRGRGRVTPRATPATCSSARPTARSSRAPRTPGSSATTVHVAPPSSISTSTACSISWWSTGSRRWRCGGTPATATPPVRSRWDRGSPCACASRPPTSTPSGRGWRRGSAIARRSTR